ncbi:MAG: hypothetical protein NTU41_01535 [Chloroflexi bacterium]|nr:hypothetical protein [Chloroflexota bacterium]
MENADDKQGLEQALAKTEADAAAALEAASRVMHSLRRVRSAAKLGDLRELRSTFEAAEKAIASLRQQFANARDGWSLDEERHLAEGLYTKELVALGQRMGIDIFERDERLYCYPSLIRISPAERAVFIDKKREKRIRPSVLVTRLKTLQRKPPSFKAEVFLEALHKSYSRAVAMRGNRLAEDVSPVVALVDVYDLLTLLPGLAREYTRQEFARDVYLLHRSGVDTTRTGARVSFPSSTGTKDSRRVISVITERGEHKRYYGISFTQSPKEQQR